MERKTVSIFGSSRPAPGEPEYRQAYELGKALAQAGFTVCNGGYGGIMEASARGAKEAGGSTVGVTVSIFSRAANQWIDQEIRMPSLMERLTKLMELGDAYLILKGGTGTLLELAAVWEFINKGLMKQKPIIVVGDFWKQVIETLRQEQLWEGLGDCTKFIQLVQTPEECVAFLKLEREKEERDRR
ncbi:MAG: LOG family protein [Bacteroidota bacterium]